MMSRAACNRSPRWSAALLGAFLFVFLFPVPACDPGSPQDKPPQDTSQGTGLTAVVVELARKMGEGEQCLVCGKLIHDGEVLELRYKGRRFYVAAAMLEDLLKDPDRYFHKLQARSALFDEEAYRKAAPMASGWLYFGFYVLAGLVCAAVCGYLAVSRGLAPIPWFFAGLVGNVVAVLVLLVMAPKTDPAAAVAGIPDGLAKVPTTREPLACASCGHLNHPSAVACSHCDQPMQPLAQSEMARLGERNRGEKNSGERQTE